MRSDNTIVAAAASAVALEKVQNIALRTHSPQDLRHLCEPEYSDECKSTAGIFGMSDVGHDHVLNEIKYVPRRVIIHEEVESIRDELERELDEAVHEETHFDR